MTTKLGYGVRNTTLKELKQRINFINLNFTLLYTKYKRKKSTTIVTREKENRLLYCNDPSGKSTEDTEERQIVFLSNPISNLMDPYPPGETYYFIGMENVL